LVSSFANNPQYPGFCFPRAHDFDCDHQAADKNEEGKISKATLEGAWVIAAVDKDGDGKVNSGEAAELFETNDKVAENLIKNSGADADGDGKLDEKELAKMQETVSEMTASDVQMASMDSNQDGKIDAKELAEATGATEETAAETIKKADKDGDGTIDKTELDAANKQVEAAEAGGDAAAAAE
jgi:Ca2+-binding EF-hand superfamily protein